MGFSQCVFRLHFPKAFRNGFAYIGELLLQPADERPQHYRRPLSFCDLLLVLALALVITNGNHIERRALKVCVGAEQRGYKLHKVGRTKTPRPQPPECAKRALKRYIIK